MNNRDNFDIGEFTPNESDMRLINKAGLDANEIISLNLFSYHYCQFGEMKDLLIKKAELNHSFAESYKIVLDMGISCVKIFKDEQYNDILDENSYTYKFAIPSILEKAMFRSPDLMFLMNANPEVTMLLREKLPPYEKLFYESSNKLEIIIKHLVKNGLSEENFYRIRYAKRNIQGAGLLTKVLLRYMEPEK